MSNLVIREDMPVKIYEDLIEEGKAEKIKGYMKLAMGITGIAASTGATYTLTNILAGDDNLAFLTAIAALVISLSSIGEFYLGMQSERGVLYDISAASAKIRFSEKVLKIRKRGEPFLLYLK